MRIGLVGTYDVDNFGDSLFPEVYAHLLRSALPEARFSLYSPRPKASQILSFEEVRPLPQKLRDAEALSEDVLILTGGETLGFGHSSGTYNFPSSVLSAYSQLWLAPLHAALNSEGSTKFIVHCVGARKMDEKINRLAAQALQGAALCTFRDAFSQSWIRDGALAFGVATDPMFLMDGLQTPEQWLQRRSALLPEKFTAGKGYLVAQISLGYGGNDLESWCRAIADISKGRDLNVALLPICHFLEDEHYLSITAARLNSLGVSNHLVRGRLNVKDTLSVIAGAQGYVGSSLHGAVAAVAFGIPLAVLGHSPDGKHEGTLNSVGIFGCTCTGPGQLPECFRHSETLDRAAARVRAHSQAQDDFNTVIAAISAMPNHNDAGSADARTAIAKLVGLERELARSNFGYMAKRFVLRQLQNAGAYAAYGRLRIRRRIAKTTRPS